MWPQNPLLRGLPFIVLQIAMQTSEGGNLHSCDAYDSVVTAWQAIPKGTMVTRTPILVANKSCLIGLKACSTGRKIRSATLMHY